MKMILTKPIRRSLLIGGFFLFAGALIATGYFYYRYASKSYRNQIELELSVIANLKVNEIEHWRAERIGDASIFYKNHQFNSLVKQYLSNPHDNTAEKNITVWLTKVLDHYNYESIYLLDTNRVRCFSIPELNFPISSAVSNSFSKVLKSKKIEFVDFYKNVNDHKIHLAVLVPIIDELDSNNVIGILGLRIDPFTYLYPFISNWPTPSKTAETLLLRREGDEIVFLNDLKFHENAALNLRVPIKGKLAIPEIKAALGEEGVVEELDYRGVPVIAATRTIHRSPWFLVTLMDVAEAFAPLKQRLTVLVILFGLILFAFGISFFAFMRQQNLRIHRENEKSLKKLNEELENRVKERTIELTNTLKLNQSILENAGEGIYGLDLECNSTFVNQVAADLLGYTREELLGIGMHAIHHECKADGSECLKIECPIYAAFTNGKSYTVIDEVFWRKDGTPFPVEYTSTPVFNEGKISGSVVLFKDISARKKVEKEIKNANRVLAVLSNINQTIVHIADKNRLFDEVCHIAVKDGLFQMAWIGLVDEQGNKVIPVAQSGFTNDYLENINIDLKDNLLSNGPTGQSILTGFHFISNDIDNNPRMIPWREKASQQGYRSSTAFPIKEFGKTIGAFMLYSNEPFFFDEPEIKLLDELASDISFACEVIETEAKRKRSEAALKESEQLFRSLFSATPDALMLIDPFDQNIDWPIIDCNEAACQMNGYTREEMIGNSIDILNKFKGTPHERVKYLEHIRSEGIVQLETTHQRRNGQLFPVDVSTTIVNINGRELILGIDRDISVRKQAEKMLIESEAIFRTMVDSVKDYGIFMMDTEGYIMNWNSGAERLKGYQKEEIVGKHFSIFFTSEDIQAGLPAKELETAATNSRSENEGWRVRKDGTRFWSSVIITAMKDETGQLIGFSKISRDLTDRKNAEQEILDLNATLEIKIEERTKELLSVNKELETQISEKTHLLNELDANQIELKIQNEELILQSSALNAAANAIVITDIEGNIQWINPAFTKLTGYTLAEVKGKNPDTLKSGKHDTAFYKNLWDTILAGKVWHGEIINKRKDESEYYEEMTITPLKDKNGEIFRFIAIKQDITERKEYERNLSEAKAEAEQANLAKSEFLSRMSHELRTPMNSILGFAQLMNMGELTPAHKKGVDHILNAGKHLLELINEVLNLSRIEAGKLTISLEPIQIYELIPTIIEMISPLAEKNAIKLELLNLNHKELYLRADYQKLKQVLLNLINNAVKFNRENGHVTVSCEVKIMETEDQRPKTGDHTSTEFSDHIHHPISGIRMVRVNITDTGHGISAEEIGKLFVPFQRVGMKVTEIEGTGLGLAVAKKLMEAMGGTIGVTSEAGVGSTFWIELPLSENPIERQKIVSDLIAKEPGKNVLTGTLLYIEDNVSNIQLIEQIIEEHLPSIRLVSEMFGKKAVQCAIDYSPDLILLDLDLPDIHGSDVLRLLHTEEKTKSIPVVIISADAMPKQTEKLLKLGARNYLTKPFDVVEFLKMIDKILIK